MRQLEGVTPQRLAANEHLREIDASVQATIANERPSEEVLSRDFGERRRRCAASC